MKCEEAGDLFSAYIQGDIEAAMAVTLENHLTGCAQCRQSVDSVRCVWSALDDLEQVDPPPFFHENLMSRIDAAMNAKAEARRAKFDWRALFQVRSLAYAAAAAVVLVAGVGGLHYSRASLDPVGSLLRMLHPAPAHVVELSAARAEWSPNAQGTGTLVVHLKAQPEADGKTNSLNCIVNVPANLLQGESIKTDMQVTSETEASISIPLTKMPAQADLSVTLSSADGGSSAVSKTEPVTLMQPIEQR